MEGIQWPELVFPPINLLNVWPSKYMMELEESDETEGDDDECIR